MRIAMIGGRGSPAGVGGVERVIENLACGLCGRGHDVLIYGRRSYVGVGGARFGRGIITAGLDGKHLDTITHTATASWDALRRGANVIHFHSPGPGLWSWLPRLAGQRIVFTVHAPDWRREKWSPAAQAVLRAGLEIGMRTAGAVTAVSQGLAEQLQGRFHRTVNYVPNGVAEARDRPPELIKRWALKPGQFALHVGRIVPEKRLAVLLEAWRNTGLNAPLIIAAEDSEKSYAEHCRRIAPPAVRFIGPQFGAVLEELYSNAALVVQPSVLEGASLVVLEAAAHGRCVISADIPANREILAEAGIYFAGDDITELAERIRRCYHDESLREEHGLASRKRVEASFSHASAVTKMEQVYRQVLESR